MATLKLILQTLAVAYVGLALFALLFANKMIFPAPPTSYADSDAVGKFTDPETGDQITTLFLPNPESRLLIFYHHGNGEDLGNIMPRLEVLRALGFAVLAWDYPGYGTSEGRPTERAILRIAGAMMEAIPEQYGFAHEQVIQYGRSLGGGPAVWLATQFPAAGLITEATFTSTFRVMTRVRLLPWDVFNNIGRIDQVSCPVLILHGTRDGVVPFHHGRRLLERAPEPKSFTWFEGGGHNNLVDDFREAYVASIREFIQQ